MTSYGLRKNILKHISDKGFVSRIYKELSNLNDMEYIYIHTYIYTYMMGIGFERHFTNDNLSMEKEHMKRHSTLLILGECKWNPQEHITTHLLGRLKKRGKKERHWQY